MMYEYPREDRLITFFARKRFLIPFFIFLLAIVGVVWALAAPAANFPKNKTIITLEEGSSLSSAAQTFTESGIVRSPFIYKVLVVALGGQKKIIAGDYLFDKPASAFSVAYRTIHGLQGIRQVKVTIPEGIASYDIARLLAKNLPNFDSKHFLELALDNEGFLFPDTYFFYENMTPEQIVKMMRANFDKKIKSAEIAIKKSSRSFEDIMIMASIVEKEARKTEDRKIIAGILWKRLDAKHLLQVDAPFFYTLGKDSAKLTLSDLASDSPYNTYKHLGLPPTPINNPGIDAILDTLNPTDTDFWFYLSDAKGITHYAITYDGHLDNKDKFIP